MPVHHCRPGKRKPWSYTKRYRLRICFLSCRLLCFVLACELFYRCRHCFLDCGRSCQRFCHNIRKKTLYVEVKRQDGWVEGGKRSDGRGNAHERSCKFFTPGLLKILRKKSRIEAPHLPFWTVFQGDITRDPCRVREITCWYEGFEAHFFFWRQAPNPELLFEHFETHLAPLLE